MTDKKELLGTAPVGKLLFKLAIPTVVAQLINMLYNIVDRIYIGHMPEIGEENLQNSSCRLSYLFRYDVGDSCDISQSIRFDIYARSGIDRVCFQSASYLFCGNDFIRHSNRVSNDLRIARKSAFFRYRCRGEKIRASFASDLHRSEFCQRQNDWCVSG